MIFRVDVWRKTLKFRRGDIYEEAFEKDLEKNFEESFKKTIKKTF